MGRNEYRMITGIEVIRTSEDKLREQSWQFAWVEPYLVLDTYRNMARASLRHKFVNLPNGFYYRFNRRENTTILDNVPLPQDVKDEAYRQFVAHIQVVKELA